MRILQILLLLLSVWLCTIASCTNDADPSTKHVDVASLVAQLDAEYAANRVKRDAFVLTAQRVSALVDAFVRGDSDEEVESTEGKGKADATSDVQQLLGGNGRKSLPSLLLYSASFVKNAVLQRSERIGRRLSLLAQASRLAVGLDAWDDNAEALMARRQPLDRRSRGFCIRHPDLCSPTPDPTSAPTQAPTSQPQFWPTSTPWLPTTTPQPSTLSFDSSFSRSFDFNCIQNDAYVVDGLQLICNLPSGTRTISSRQYALNAQKYRGYCQPSGPNADMIFERCVCPRGYITLVNGHLMECQALDVEVKFEVPGLTHCHGGVFGSDEGPDVKSNDICVNTSRHADLTLLVEMHFDYLSAAETLTRHSLSGFVVPDNYTDDTRFLSEYTRGVQSKSFNETVAEAYKGYYCLYGEGTDSHAFNVVYDHPFLMYTKFFQGVFAFDRPELIPSQLQGSWITCATLGEWFNFEVGPVGRTTWQLPISSLPNAFIEGGQMYGETGFISSVVSGGANALRLHISFYDLPEPADRFDYDYKFNKGYIALIVVGCLVGCAVIASVFWQLCASNVEPEDNLVSHAQRKMEIKAHHDKKSQ